MIDLDGLTTGLVETAYYAGPAVRKLDPEMMTTTDGNRWSAPGEPTIYLASDLGVALAEFARHAPSHHAPDAHVWSVDLRLDAAIDLRRDDVRSRLGVADDPRWFLDPERCRSFAKRVREPHGSDGLIVPSVAMLDETSRWNAVVFVDRLRHPLPVAVRPIQAVVRIGPGNAKSHESRRRCFRLLPTRATRPITRERDFAARARTK